MSSRSSKTYMKDKIHRKVLITTASTLPFPFIEISPTGTQFLKYSLIIFGS